MIIVRALGVAALVALAGCPRPMPPTASAATVKAAELPADADALVQYADAEVKKDQPSAVENALIALDKARAADAQRFDVLWRGAHVCAWLADDSADKERRAGYARRGIEWAKAAVQVDPKRVEGQYYLGINLGLEAQTKTLGGRDMVPQVAKAASEAAALDEKFDHAGPLRLLGALYANAPLWPASIGDIDEGLKHLSRAVELAGHYPLNHLLYGQALVIGHKYPEAERECADVLRAPLVPEWAHRLERWRREAEACLKKQQKKKSSGTSPGSGSPF
jgi:hypothetical protein